MAEFIRIVTHMALLIIFMFALGTLIVHFATHSALTVVDFEKLKGEDAIITLSDGRQFRGSGTVWREWPSGRRAPTGIEALCADEWTKQMWGGSS